MAEPHVVSGLKAKRSEIVREIDRLEAVIAGHRADLSIIDAATAIVTGKPAGEASQKRKRLFQRGEIGRLVFAALRRSERPVSTAEIAALMATEGKRPTLKSLGKSLAKFRERGDVTGERKGNMTWWRLP